MSLTTQDLVDRARDGAGPASKRIAELYTAAIEGWEKRHGWFAGETTAAWAARVAFMAYLDELAETPK